MSKDDDMTCHNCERKTSWLRTRCRTCQSRLPAWYVAMTIALGTGIYAALVVLENIF